MKKRICSRKVSQLEILRSDCNISTVEDGREVFLLDVWSEYSRNELIYYYPIKVRGNHYHQSLMNIGCYRG